MRTTHSAYNPSTGLFTAPIDGVYAIDFVSNHATLDNVGVYKNGTVLWIEVTGSAGQLCGHHATMRLKAGDTLALMVVSTGTTASALARIAITWLGK